MPDLFNQDPLYNRLPYQGDVRYHGPIFSLKEANQYRDILLSAIDWQPDEAFIFGKHYITKRKVAWYGDEAYNLSLIHI